MIQMYDLQTVRITASSNEINRKMIETTLNVLEDLVMMPSNFTRVDDHLSRVVVAIV